MSNWCVACTPTLEGRARDTFAISLFRLVLRSLRLDRSLGGWNVIYAYHTHTHLEVRLRGAGDAHAPRHESVHAAHLCVPVDEAKVIASSVRPFFSARSPEAEQMHDVMSVAPRAPAQAQPVDFAVL